MSSSSVNDDKLRVESLSEELKQLAGSCQETRSSEASLLGVSQVFEIESKHQLLEKHSGLEF